MQPSTPPPAEIYQLKIALIGISPLIWRRLLVHSASSIAELHHIIQIAMGWEDSTCIDSSSTVSITAFIGQVASALTLTPSKSS